MNHNEYPGNPRCPKCGATAVFPESAVHKPGDTTVCIYCATPSRFTADMVLATFELDELDAETRKQMDRELAFIFRAGRRR
jgi:hypothetical protein